MTCLNERVLRHIKIMPNKGNTADRYAPADFFVGIRMKSYVVPRIVRPKIDYP